MPSQTIDYNDEVSCIAHQVNRQIQTMDSQVVSTCHTGQDVIKIAK